MSDLSLIPHLRGCLAAVALGDAIGLPWELKTAEQMFAETDGLGVVGVNAIPDDHAFSSLRGLPLGSTSDD
ncbi:ADP-ribosylglycohydrolase family protein, partial [bacterium]|nr:ADP-ribosylglycohydrolase family protein [bacterium]